jgi:nucleoid-associated protein YgaU
MKHLLTTLKAAAFVVALSALSTAAYAQYPADFTKDQADSTIKYRNTEITNLQSEISSIDDQIKQANADLQQRMADNTKCRDGLYAMLGSDRNGYNAYRERLARDEQELNALRAMPANQLSQSMPRMNALETEIRALRGDKLVLIRDHYQRVTALSNGYMQLKHGMMPSNSTYTVGTWKKDRDCLWNIAKKPEIYNDPFAWPKIWRANQDIIHNPDIIHPGQQLQIVKTEVTPEDRDATGYRHKRH